MSISILLMEDDFDLAEVICEYLESEGYKVSHCRDAQSAEDLAYERSFDLFLLDVRVPFGNGFELLQSLRDAGKSTPAIFLTSLISIEDIKQGFRAGCDDYLKKPFELEELQIRMEALLKRRFMHTVDETVDLGNGVVFNPLSHSIDKNGAVLSLSQKETRLLKLFLENQERILSKKEIFDSLWDFNEEPSDMSLRAYVSKIRAILGRDSVKNVRGSGYLFAKK